MSHSENILAALDAQRCTECGGPAVRGATVCLRCVPIKTERKSS